MSTLTLADKASTSGASASTSKMEAGDLHDPLLEAGIAADEALADPLASSTTGEQEKEEKKENPDPSLQLVGGHKNLIYMRRKRRYYICSWRFSPCPC